MRMNELFNIGDKISGFCNGYFGRDNYETKMCILVNNSFALFKYVDGEDVVVLNLSDMKGNTDEFNKKMVDEWKDYNEE